MNAEQLANLTPDKVTLYDVAQTLAVVVQRMDKDDELRAERMKARAIIDRQAADDHADVLGNLAELSTAVGNAAQAAAENSDKLDIVLARIDADPGGLADHESRISEVELEDEIDGRMKNRTRGFWKDPVTLLVIGFILTAIVVPLGILAWTALDDNGKLDTAVEQSGTAAGQSSATCKRSFNGLINQFDLGNYTRREYAKAVLQLTSPDKNGNPGCDPALAVPLPPR